jgi:hypothetical protein
LIVKDVLGMFVIDGESWLIVLWLMEILFKSHAARRTPLRFFVLIPPLCFSQMSNQQSQPMAIGAKWHFCAILSFSTVTWCRRRWLIVVSAVEVGRAHPFEFLYSYLPFASLKCQSKKASPWQLVTDGIVAPF